MVSQECPASSKAETDDEEDEESDEEEEEEEEEEDEEEVTDSEEEDLEPIQEGQEDDEEEEEKGGMSRKVSSCVSSLCSLGTRHLFETLPFLLLCQVFSQQHSSLSSHATPPLFLLFQVKMEAKAPCPHHRSPLKRTWNLAKGSGCLRGISKTKDS